MKYIEAAITLWPVFAVVFALFVLSLFADLKVKRSIKEAANASAEAIKLYREIAQDAKDELQAWNQRFPELEYRSGAIAEKFAEDETVKKLRPPAAEVAPSHAATFVGKIPPNYLRYFVAYSYMPGGGCSGYGCLEMGRSQTIRSQADITMMTELISDYLRDQHGFQKPQVVILYWQPFEHPRQDGGGRETVDDDAPSAVVLRLAA